MERDVIIEYQYIIKYILKGMALESNEHTRKGAKQLPGQN